MRIKVVFVPDDLDNVLYILLDLSELLFTLSSLNNLLIFDIGSLASHASASRHLLADE